MPIIVWTNICRVCDWYLSWLIGFQGHKLAWCDITLTGLGIGDKIFLGICNLPLPFGGFCGSFLARRKLTPLEYGAQEAVNTPFSNIVYPVCIVSLMTNKFHPLGVRITTILNLIS